MGYTWDLQIKLFKHTLIVVTLISGIAVFTLEKPLPFIYALIFGTLIGLLNFRNLALTLEKAVTMAPAQAQIYAGSRYFIRYFINGIVIFVSIKGEHLSVFGAILGLFIIKLVVVATNLFNDIHFFKRIFFRKEEE
ncbi:MAG: ATP synthase subunit I [Thermotaleaceae bacterium]